jgi:pyruvate formate lyase activating enzyme
MKATAHPARWWRRLEDGRLECGLCPRHCRLNDGQRAFCFVRERVGDAIVLNTYGRSSGFCVDPIEKKPLHHFLPGTAVLSFGTAGCNLGCRFCQNWGISKSREIALLSSAAHPETIACAAEDHACASVAYTYNDPIVFAEYAIDTAIACRQHGIRNVAVTSGFISAEARPEFFAFMDAANVDLKAFREGFYRGTCLSGPDGLAAVLETLEWIVHASPVWLEITTLLIPGLNDSDHELRAECAWIRDHLRDDVPLHFTAFHPDFRMTDRPATPVVTLQRARRIALEVGLRHVYTGNVHDPEGQVTRCAACGARLIARDAYRILEYRLDRNGRCPDCTAPLAGAFAPEAGAWGARCLPVSL